MCNQNRYCNTAIVAAKVPSGTNNLQFNFNDQPLLKDKFVTAIEVFTVNDMSLTPDGTALCTAAQLQKAYLTLCIVDSKGVSEWVKDFPVMALHRMSNASSEARVFDIPSFADRVIEWSKSYVKFASSIAPGTDVAAMFNVSYSDAPRARRA